MRLAVDAHLILADRRGIGVYARALVSRLAHFPGMELTLLTRDLFPARRRGPIARELGIDGFRLARRVPRDADVVWHPWTGTFFASDVPAVSTIHDCTPFAYPAASPRIRKREQDPFFRSAARSRRFIADSEFTREESVRYLHIERDRIDVVYLAADPCFSPGAPQHLNATLREKPYVLFVGAPDERKNLETLVRAYHQAFPAKEVLFVCVTTAEVAGAITLHGLSRDALRDLYRGALCYAMPSTYEGFGLPALEAMQCGTPVIVSNAASLPEVCGDGARYVNDPLSVEEWASALREIARDQTLRETLRERGPQRASLFSWDAAAAATYQTLARAARE